MTKLFAIVAVIFGMVFVSGCQSSRLDASLQQNLPKICDAAAQGHSAFVVIAATGTLKASLVRKEAAAWSALMVVCRDPGSVNSRTALVTAATAYAALLAALKDAG